MSFLRILLRRIFLILLLTYKYFLRNFISTSGLLITLFIIITMLAVLRPLKHNLVQKITNALPGDVIRVTAQTKRQKIDLLGIFSGSNDYKIGVQFGQIQQIRKMEEVTDVGFTSILQMPLTGTIDEPFFKSLGAHSELILQGVSYNLAKPYLRCNLPYKNTFRNNIITVPVLIPESFADIAIAFAAMNGLPTFSKNQMIGLKFKFQLGNSIVQQRRHSFIIPVRGVICGFAPSNVVSVIGVPYSWVNKLHRSRKMKKAANSFDQVFVFVDKNENIEPVTQKIKALRLNVPKAEQNFEQLFSVVKNFDLFFALFALVMGVLSLIAMVNSFMLLAYQRKYEFGLYLVFGSSPVFIWLLMILQGFFYGALHSVLAIWLAEDLFLYLRSYFMEYEIFAFMDLSNLAFQLSNLEKFYIISGSMLVAALSSLLPSLLIMGTKTIHLIRRDS